MARKIQCDRCKEVWHHGGYNPDAKGGRYVPHWQGQKVELSNGMSYELCKGCIEWLQNAIEKPITITQA